MAMFGFLGGKSETWKSDFDTLVRTYSYAKKGDLIVVETDVSEMQAQRKAEECCYKLNGLSISQKEDLGGMFRYTFHKDR